MPTTNNARQAIARQQCRQDANQFGTIVYGLSVMGLGQPPRENCVRHEHTSVFAPYSRGSRM